MSQGDSNPAAIPHAAEDIQGDDRWMSQVKGGAPVLFTRNSALHFLGSWPKLQRGVFNGQQELITICKNLMLEMSYLITIWCWNCGIFWRYSHWSPLIIIDNSVSTVFFFLKLFKIFEVISKLYKYYKRLRENFLYPSSRLVTWCSLYQFSQSRITHCIWLW